MTVALPPPPRTQRLGENGPEVSALAWGMWRYKGEDLSAARALVEAALNAGINFLDTADIYGVDTPAGFGSSEVLLGRVLADAPELRNRMVLASKGGIDPGIPYDSSASYLTAAVDASLRRLDVERLDLWQVHRPDILVHPEALAETLTGLVGSGKVGAIGVSNFTKDQITALKRFLTIPLVSTQPELSPFAIGAVENGLLDQAIRMGALVMAWSPLGGGRIAHASGERDCAILTALTDIANAKEITPAIAAYSWIMAHPARPIPIIGSQKAERIAEAVGALDVEWTRTEWYAVLTAARGVPLP
ncbi:MAG: aldo/keto reductase [Pseudomonadota bacterium]